jgi:predicted ribosome quality control (RQC) complex YloA/Tae2 family protein
MLTHKIFFPNLKIEVTYAIGRSAVENVELIKNAEPHHIWFHIDGSPSGHVIAAIPSTMTIDRKNLAKIITQGAVLCKSHSKFASDKNVNIVYTVISNLTLDETRIGTVTTQNAKIKTI